MNFSFLTPCEVDMFSLEFFISLCFIVKTMDAAQNCSWSHRTLHVVSYCPLTIDEKVMAEKIKKCDGLAGLQDCSGSSLFKYHCVLNEAGDKFIEVCAPEVKIFLGHCATFNITNGRIEQHPNRTCNRGPNPCPLLYVSSESYQFPICYGLPDNFTTYGKTTERSNTTACSEDTTELNFILIVIISVISCLYIFTLPLICCRDRVLLCLRKCIIHLRCSGYGLCNIQGKEENKRESVALKKIKADNPIEKDKTDEFIRDSAKDEISSTEIVLDYTVEESGTDEYLRECTKEKGGKDEYFIDDPLEKGRTYEHLRDDTLVKGRTGEYLKDDTLEKSRTDENLDDTLEKGRTDENLPEFTEREKKMTMVPEGKLHQLPKQISSICITNICSVNHISHIFNGIIWLSNRKHVMKINRNGNILQKFDIDDAHGSASHTIDRLGDLLFIKNNKVFRVCFNSTKLLIKPEGWKILSIYYSRINDDIILGTYDMSNNEINSQLSRWNETGKLINTIEFYKGKKLYALPMFISENINGDICTTDSGTCMVKGVDKLGNLHFYYDGKSTQTEEFCPTGICNDAYGHVIVCNRHDENPSVHVLDLHGRFLTIILRANDGIRDPYGLCVDKNGVLYLGQYDSNIVTVYRYLDEK